MASIIPSRDLVPHRQPAPLRRGRPRPGGRAVQEIVDAGRLRRRPGAGRRQAGAHRPAAIRAAARGQRRPTRCVGVIAWMHTFSPAKMWIAGLDALRKPLLHLHTQANRGAAVGRDRHGLHEPQPGRPRRPRVRLHPDPARRRPQDGGRPRVRPRGGPRGSASGRGRRGWRRAAHAAARPVRRQHARRRRHRGRQGRGRAALRRLGQHVGRQRPGRRGRRGRGRRRRRPRRGVRRTYDVAAELRPAATGTSRCATAPASRLGCARSSTDGGFGVHHELRGPRRAAPAARPGRAAADGRRLRLRRRGRLEDLGLLRALKVDGGGPARRDLVHGGLHLPPGPRRAEDPRRAHARGLPVHRGRPARVEIHPLGIGGREDPVRLVFDADPAPAVVLGMADLGDRFRLGTSRRSSATSSR